MLRRPLGFGEFIGRRRQMADSESFSFIEIADEREAVVPRHTHEDAHFVIVVRGTYETSATGIDGRCGAGSVLFNPAGTTHRDRFVSDRGRFVTISIRRDRLAGLAELAPLAPRACSIGESAIGPSARRIIREIANLDAMSPLVLEGLALEMIGLASRDSPGRRDAPAWLVRAKELLEDRCLEALPLSNVAAQVGVHSYHLTRMFKRFYQATPGEFGRRCRLERATELLRDPRLSIAEVALRCGYADQTQLTRSLRRDFGVTPGRLRRTTIVEPPARTPDRGIARE
ncbi:MAG TPA: AraC family transcriptional regulator [Gemmatimonadaceae bacterium]|jgi:AraC family transcriptional regulator